jgi:hypothetical protein
MLAGLLLAFSPATALATDVRLVNYVSYSYIETFADLETDGIQNFDTSPSDSLRLELWAFYSPYALGMGGYRLAVYPLAGVGPGVQTGVIDSGPVAFSAPAGVWHLSMILTEYVQGSQGDDGYVLRYFINFPTPEYLGVPVPTARATLDAIEFYHAGLDHYFIAAAPQEIHDLDTGVHPGWSRTGHSFSVWGDAGANSVPVCRYYIPPGHGDSHFLSASPQECAIAPVMFPWIEKETDAAFDVALPDEGTGACASNELPVYRLWNNRADSNHRYTTFASVKALMIAHGYVAEGYGPDQVAMCVPQ